MNLCVTMRSPVNRSAPLIRLVNALSARGVTVDVVGPATSGEFPVTGDGADADRIRLHAFRLPASGLEKRLRYVTETIRLARSLRRIDRGDWDAVIAFNPYGLMSAYLAGLGIVQPLIYYGLELFDGGRMLPARVQQVLSRRRVHALIAAQEDRLKMEADFFGLPRGRTCVVPNSCFDELPGLAREGYAGARPPAPPTRFVYQGSSHLRKRRLLEIVEALGNHERDVELHHTLVGGDERNRAAFLDAVARTSNPRRFREVPYAAYPGHFAHTVKCHVGLMLYDPDVNLNYRFCAPNKLYEYTMLGLPIIASGQDHLRRIIEGNGFGICVDPKKPHTIARAVARLTDPELQRDMGERGRRWYEEHGKYDVAADRLLPWLQDQIDDWRGCAT